MLQLARTLDLLDGRGYEAYKALQGEHFRSRTFIRQSTHEVVAALNRVRGVEFSRAIDTGFGHGKPGEKLDTMDVEV